MIGKLFPNWKLSWKFPLKFIGTAISLIILLYYRELFFQPSLLTKVTVEVPLENRRPAVFYFLIAVTLISCADQLSAAYGRRAGKTFYAFGGVFGTIASLGVMFLNSIVSFYLVELINNYYLVQLKDKYRWLGIFITLAFYIFFVFVTNSLSVGMVAGNILFLVWGMVNYFVQQFRGIPFQWIDFGSMRTGLSVSGNYTYKPTWQIVAAVVLTAAICGFYLHARIWHNFRKLPGKIVSRGIAVAVFFVFSGLIFHTDFLADQGIWLRDWQPWYTYRLFGMESGFLAFARASYPQAPETYSAGRVRTIIRESEERTEGMGDEALPIPDNIICIMNESFADLTTYPNFQTDVPLLTRINSLDENTQSGKLMVSVKGGTTANTEYEFLTGNSCVLSPTTVVYNSFIKQDQFSLARILSEQGYRSVALHPYGQYGWNRNVVYPRMGFEEFFHINNSFEGVEKLRGFVSDWGDYQQIIREVEGKEEGEKLFLFNITMQNHSSYRSDSITNDVDVIGFHGENEGQAEQYCTLIKISDEAVGRLLDYFSEQDEKTLILFWGDHQPEIGDDFWEYCYGKSLSDLSFEELQKEYETLYFVWANYDIPEKKDQTLSANYLSSYLLSLTGLQLTGYQKFLLNQMETIPAMNSYGYLGTDGRQHEWGGSDAGEEESAELEDYECLIYNELTAGSARDAGFFGIGGS